MLFQGKLIDDMAAIFGNMAATALDIKRDMDQYAANQLEKFADRLQLATRNDTEELRSIAERARAENSALKARIDELESRLAEAGASSANRNTTKQRVTVTAEA
jgi:BMFP domain-containing protein YqiC